MNTFKFPLVFNVNGIATLEEGSREYYSQLITNIARVEFGELPLRPDIGVPDTTFVTTGTFTPIVSAVARHIPEIAVTSITQEDSTETSTLGTSTLTINFEVVNAVA